MTRASRASAGELDHHDEDEEALMHNEVVGELLTQLPVRVRKPLQERFEL